MSVDENDIEKPQPPRRKRSIVKTLIKILLPLAIIIGALQYVCYYHALPLVKNRVCDAVYNNSKGLYTMDFKGLRINILGRRIEVDSFSLQPDTAAYLRRIEQEHYNKAIYNISADHLLIEHIGIKSFFSKNELYIKQIAMQHPVVRLVGKPNKSADEKPKYDAVHTDLYPIVSQYFKSLNIRHIGITDGYFDFHTKISDNQRFGISNIDISLTNFYLDEAKFKARNQFYYSDVIEIRSKNYNIALADGIHRITAGNLTISTKDSSIYAKDVQMIADGRKRATDNRFDAALDSIVISGLDISRAYFQKDVNLSGVRIYSPHIKFQNGGKVNPESKQFESKTTDLYSLIQGTLRRISVDSIKVSDASMLLTKPTAKQPAFDIDKIDIQLQDFMLDSLANRDKNKILYSENLEIGIKKYRMLLPDLRHLFAADSVLVSTSQGVVKASKIMIKPIAATRRTPTEKAITMSIPKLEVSDIDFKKAYNTQIFEIGTLKITLPDIKTRSFINSNDNDSTAAKPAPGKGKLLTALSNEYFKSLRIKTAQIYRGKVDITSKASIEEDSLTFSGKFSIIVGNLTLNRSIIADEMIPFRSNSLKLNVEDAVIKPSKSIHTLRCGHLTVDTQKDKVSMKDFSFSSDNDTSTINSLRRLHKHSLLDIKISQTEFSKTNLIDFLYHGKVDIEKIKIQNPHFFINLYPELRRQDRQNLVMDSARIAMEHELDSILQKFRLMDRMIARIIPKQLNLIKIDTLQADSSVLSFNIRDTLNNITTGTSSNFRLNANGFYYNKDSVSPETKIMLAKSYELDLSNFKFLLPDKTHIVNTGNIKISTDDGNISVTDISVYPDNMLDINTKNQINASCPAVKVLGVDFAAYDSTGVFRIDSCNFDKATVEIMRTQDTVRDTPNRSKRRRQSFFNGLIINNIHSFGSSFAMNDENADKIAGAMLDVSCQNFCLDSANLAKANSLITFENPYLDLSDIFAKIKLNHLTVNHLHHENDSTIINGFAFGNPADTTRAGVKAPEIRLTGLDYQKLAFNKKVAANSLYVLDPEIRITQKVKDPNKPRKRFSLDNMKWNFCIDDVSSDGASINLKRPLKHDLFWDKIDLRADGIDTEREHISAYPADHILVGINDYTFNFRDSIYRINFGRAVVDPINRTGIIDQVDYRPKMGRYDYFNHFDVRKTAIYFNCEKGYVYDFDVPKIFTDKKIDIGRLDVERFSMQSYENQSKPNDMVTPKPNLHAFIKERIPVKITVDTTYVHNSFVGIEQLNPEAAVPGILTINDIDGVVYNFTNDPTDIIRNNSMLMKATGKLMNISNVSAKIKYEMDSPTDEFYCNFHADSVSLPDLNPYLENAIFAKINDGTVSGAQVNFRADNIESRGESHIVYRDLKLQVNKKDSVQQRRRGLLSFLANTVVRTKNSRKIGYIYVKNDPARSFAGYWVQSILSGVKATAGFENKQQKGERRFAKKVLDVVMRRKLRQEYIIGE